MKSQERLILLGDKLIFMIKLDLTEGEVPPHPNPPPPRGEGGVGEDNQVSLLCNVRVNKGGIAYPTQTAKWISIENQEIQSFLCRVF